MTMFRAVATHGEELKLSRCRVATRSVHLQIRKYIVKVINKLRDWL